MSRWTNPAGRVTLAGLLLSAGVASVMMTLAAATGPETDPAPPSPAAATEAFLLAGVGQVVIDLTKVRGNESCRDCHSAAYDAWTQSSHYATWTTMHSRPVEDGNDAKTIVTAMGGKSIKRDDLCFQCHYTAQEVKGRVKAISGVSCESCHGAAADWIDTHPAAKDAASESERQAIYAKCDEAGMLRPVNAYLVARNCFSCHTVPNEKLVNVGGHNAGSEFELVAWSQGEVRHNYQFAPDGKNQTATADRLRVLYVVGRLTDLEYGLRGLAKATEDGNYRVAMIARVSRALEQVNTLLAAVNLPKIKEAVPTADVAPGDPAALTAAADTLSAAIRAFAAKNDASGLAGVDAMLPSSEKYKGQAHP